MGIIFYRLGIFFFEIFGEINYWCHTEERGSYYELWKSFSEKYGINEMWDTSLESTHT